MRIKPLFSPPELLFLPKNLDPKNYCPEKVRAFPSQHFFQASQLDCLGFSKKSRGNDISPQPRKAAHLAVCHGEGGEDTGGKPPRSDPHANLQRNTLGHHRRKFRGKRGEGKKEGGKGGEKRKAGPSSQPTNSTSRRPAMRWTSSAEGQQSGRTAGCVEPAPLPIRCRSPHPGGHRMGVGKKGGGGVAPAPKSCVRTPGHPLAILLTVGKKGH